MLGKIKKNFGFGCMRLPMAAEEVDLAEFSKMIDAFMEAGFNYFDTATVYLDGKSETAIRECLVKRYPREDFIIVDKLSPGLVKETADVRKLFESQLQSLGVDYIDIYLMHSQNRVNYERYKSIGAYEEAFKLKEEGKVGCVGFSFHDTADILDKILTEYPQIEVVQLQVNYYDFEDRIVQSRLCLEVCKKHGKPVIVMEPVRGGMLAAPPAEAGEIVKSLKGGSPASYAIRFAAGCEGVIMVLSGMGNMEMMEDNISAMKEYKPLTDAERETLFSAAEAIRSKNIIACTCCRYCVPGCPMGIEIPTLFDCLNSKRTTGGWQGAFFYEIKTKESAPASACIECGACEDICPQKLNIRELLKEVSAEFDKK